MATTRKGKPAARGKAAPLQVVDAPLASLSRDQLSVFLYVALTPEETRAIVKERRLSIPGFRSEALGDVERCDVIADEVRANPGGARWVLDLLEKAFAELPLARTVLGPDAARDLLTVGGGESALALSLWRVLSDGAEATRAAALPFLDRLAAHYFAPGEGSGPEEGPHDDPSAQVDALVAELARMETRAKEAEQAARERAEETRRRNEEQRDKLQSSLREARAAESRAVDESARAQEEAEGARAETARVRAELDALRASDAAADAQRARAEARDLAGRLGALEGRLERAREREQELMAAVERARAAVPTQPTPAAGDGGPAPDVLEGDLETWLFPLYTREFYDSLDGWDRRIQRAAFKQANLLALDHRHPSLRAIPLEGLPGYYRVRVATDVRLIYRRLERQNVVEILSLIDREDLDRYIRQAKTRG